MRYINKKSPDRISVRGRIIVVPPQFIGETPDLTGSAESEAIAL
ncbi:hypothetical protein predicted by Glimmer/Critica [Ruminococcus bicirculans (ex Wegman et al. 2014)]|uniref:Uncharacterized protein n=1 Tax=Ruminococcus bicirculans (ex Wegman et al. 2014) TaxID=1160721 RepID=A0ABP1WKI9_9FIRM|nr:hypothetical protein predicted by Glimmer/Critica [Ruminococcus bicirculans (ex Wegman et al. 2014)]